MSVTETLIGFTDKGVTPMDPSAITYPGAIPVEDVHRLIGFEVVEKELVAMVGDKRYRDTRRKVLVAPDKELVETVDGKTVTRKGVLLGIHRKSYKLHPNIEWGMKVTEDVLGDSLVVGACGTQRDYAVCWIQVEVPDNIATPEGVEFRPHILFRTSYDGTISSTWSRSIQNVLCTNMMAVVTNEHGGAQYRVRHTSNSDAQISNVAEALQIMQDASDDFSREVAELCATTVTDHEFGLFLEKLFPTQGVAPATVTRRSDKQATLRHLWEEDERVAPWNGTAWGALQAINTAQQHELGQSAESLMTKRVYGKLDTEDVKSLATLQAVLA